MMSAAAFRASQRKAPHQLVVDVVSRQSAKLASSAGYKLIARNPAMIGPGIRRLQNPATSLWKNQIMSGQLQQQQLVVEERWQRNFRRLVARRMLELAALAAISRQYQHLVTTQMEQAPALPSQWQHWEHRDWTDDLMETLGRTKVERVWVAFKRLVSLGLLVSPMTVLMPLSYVSDTAKSWYWDYALWGIENAGPTAIKLVQWATTRQDLFSPEFCLHFGKLRDDTKGHSFKETMQILQEELGAHHGEILEMNPTPIGSGCIAQVYYGKLLQATKKHPVGTEIALKIQHPGIWHKVCVDFYILAKVAKFLEGIPKLNLRYLSLADTVRQFRDIMLPQLDLRLEAKHLQRFNQDFVNDENVSFPHPIDELTSTRALVETFVHGTPILDYTKAPLDTRRKVALIGLETTLKMIFLHDFVHGDLHPGNILVSMRENGEPRLHFLDCGLVVEVGPHQHVNMVKILGAFTRRNGRLAGQLMVDTASESQASEWDIETFVSGIERMTIDDYNNNFIEKVGDYIADICFMACRHKVKLEATFVNAALAVEIMEGIAAALYPDMHVQPIALPLIVKAELMHRLPKFWAD